MKVTSYINSIVFIGALFVLGFYQTVSANMIASTHDPVYLPQQNYQSNATVLPPTYISNGNTPVAYQVSGSPQAPVVYYVVNPPAVSTAKTQTQTKTTTVAKANTVKASTAKTTTAVSASDANTNGLTALSLNGSNSFMPSTIWQWILVILLILAIIVMARQFQKTSTHGGHAGAHS